MNQAMKTLSYPSSGSRGFTLAEVVIAMGIVAGTLAVLAGIMSVLTRDVAQVRPYEASKRQAFDPGQASATSTSSSTTDTASTSGSTSNSTTPKPLPDEQLDPAKGRDETNPTLDPDDPDAKPAASTSGSAASGSSSTPANP